MRRLLQVVAVAALALASLLRIPRGQIHYYIQLIRATDSSETPQRDSRPVGPKLAATLSSRLRWKHYWEIYRRQADIPLGGKAMLALANQRAIEIDLTHPGKRTTVVLENGKSLGNTIEPITTAFTIAGGNRDDDTAWFIVVRRDEPGG